MKNASSCIICIILLIISSQTAPEDNKNKLSAMLGLGPRIVREMERWWWSLPCVCK